MNSPVVTDTDRQRGWKELEIQFRDGSRQTVRIHALDNQAFVSLAELFPVEAMTECLGKSLHVDAEFFLRIEPASLCAVMAMLKLLSFGDATSSVGMNRAALSLSNTVTANTYE